MSNWAIVAIPEKNDLVWKLSSEKVPHMTILSLGEHDEDPTTAKVLGYIEHAIDTVLHRFRMSVDRRGTLGPNEADVLFFDRSYCDRELMAFRASLLKDPDLLEWYNTSDQFEGWIPHLTLGFPESPAHPDTRDYPEIYSVGFDKIALWVDNYDGPEFELKSHNYDLLEQSMDLTKSVASIVPVDPDDALQYGRLGMKWGVRRARGADGRVVESKAKATRKVRRDLRKAGLHTISDEELKALTDRINLENNYRKATSEASRVKAFNARSRVALDLGKNANDALKFAASPVGQAILNKVNPKLAVSAQNTVLLGKAGQMVTDTGVTGKKKKKIQDAGKE